LEVDASFKTDLYDIEVEVGDISISHGKDLNEEIPTSAMGEDALFPLEHLETLYLLLSEIKEVSLT
jgi:hypothetical protein